MVQKGHEREIPAVVCFAASLTQVCRLPKHARLGVPVVPKVRQNQSQSVLTAS